MQEIQFETSKLVVGYMKNDLQLCFDTKSRGLLSAIGISFASLKLILKKKSLNLFDISYLSEMTLFLSVKDNVDWFFRIVFEER